MDTFFTVLFTAEIIGAIALAVWVASIVTNFRKELKMNAFDSYYDLKYKRAVDKRFASLEKRIKAIEDRLPQLDKDERSEIAHEMAKILKEDLLQANEKGS